MNGGLFSTLKRFFFVFLGPYFTFLADLSKRNVALLWEWFLNTNRNFRLQTDIQITDTIQNFWKSFFLQEMMIFVLNNVIYHQKTPLNIDECA